MAEQDPRRRAAVVAWSMYDFANSAFAALVVTFIYSAYFASKMAGDEITGMAMWSRAVATTGIVVALLSPPLGALADRYNLRRTFLFVATVACVACTAALYFPVPGQATEALAWFVAANIAFELGSVFYNAYLPQVAPPEQIGRISGYGWAAGYVGQLLCMGVALVGFIIPDVPWFGFSTDGDEHIRAVNLLVAVWFAVFSIPIFVSIGGQSDGRAASGPSVAATFRELARTFRHLRTFPQITRLLVARLFYQDGMVTVFAFGGMYAQGTFGFTTEKLMYFGLLLSVTAGVGAFAFGFLDDRLGGKRTVQVSLVGLIFASVAAVITHSEAVFWVAGSVIGLLSGPVQSASRSLMARFVPAHMENEFFGFFAFSGKATAFVGPLLLGLLAQAFDSQRAGISVVVLLLAVGGMLLLRVDEREGQAAAAG